MTLFFDTETTGVPPRGAQIGGPAFPHVCQLGAQLEDAAGRIVCEMNVLVKPHHWSIPAEASAIHGITTESCERYGLAITTVAKLFAQMVRRAELLVAHNFPFDRDMMHTEFVRCQYADELALFLAAKSFCTMQATTDVCKLPLTARQAAFGITGFKQPRLGEAYEFLFGEKFVGAHDAMEDVRGCRRIYRELKRRAEPVMDVPDSI